MSYSTTSPSNPEHPQWADPTGLPTTHVAQAALHAASLIDAGGSRLSEARESYWHKATGGIFSADSLALGELLLKDTGLIVERDGRLYLSAAMESMLDGSIEDAVSSIALEALCLSTAQDGMDPATTLTGLVPDPQRREELLLARAQRFDDRTRRLIGEIGEELVVAAARQELIELGRADLARNVRRVSLESDALGYDVKAPRTSGRPRLLEVKSTTRVNTTFVVHISRNEASTGETYPDWALVVCQVEDLEARRGTICGWCHAGDFIARLPQDPAGGKWEQAAIQLSIDDLTPGIPLPTL